MTETGRVDEVLRQILALTREERSRLLQIILVLDAGDEACTPRQDDPGLRDDEEVTDFLMAIQGESPWTRLQLLLDAHHDASTQSAAERLEAARTALLARHPATAVRASVSDLMRRQPAAVVVGVIGLLSAAGAALAKLMRLAL